MTTGEVVNQIKDGELYANHNPHWWITAKDGKLNVSYFCCETCGNYWDEEYSREKILKEFPRDEWSLVEENGGD